MLVPKAASAMFPPPPDPLVSSTKGSALPIICLLCSLSQTHLGPRADLLSHQRPLLGVSSAAGVQASQDPSVPAGKISDTTKCRRGTSHVALVGMQNGKLDTYLGRDPATGPLGACPRATKSHVIVYVTHNEHPVCSHPWQLYL